MKELSYTVFFEPLEEEGYNVVVPAIPEICTFGETIEEARNMATDAIRCYLVSWFYNKRMNYFFFPSYVQLNGLALVLL